MTGRPVVIRGDARHLPLPDASVDLLVTSPPFYGLRSYTDAGQHYADQIGSEDTPQAYLEALWECVAEWRRVLKPSGSLFVELGDKYAAGHGGSSTEGNGITIRKRSSFTAKPRQRPDLPDPPASWSTRDMTPRHVVPGTAPKSLLGLPWRFAIGCTDRLGLILRAEICWNHVNGLPESVTDRVRRAHSTVFHFVKSPRYYAAVDEIREPHTADTLRPSKHGGQPFKARNASIERTGRGEYLGPSPLGKLPGSVWDIPSAPLTVPPELGVDHFAAFPPALVRPIVLGWSPPGVCTACGEGRRPVTEGEYRKHRPSGGTMSRIERGNKVHDGGAGQWGTFGTNLRREVNITGYACACTPYTDHPGTGESSGPNYSASLDAGNGYANHGVTSPIGGPTSLANRPKVGPWREYHFDRWTAPPTRPALVVDPFGGTGTVALVASVYGRDAVSVDRSADYCRIAKWRTQDPGERARVLGVPKPPPVARDQAALFDMEVS